MINQTALRSLAIRTKIDLAIGRAVGKSLKYKQQGLDHELVGVSFVFNRRSEPLLYVIHTRGEIPALRFWDTHLRDVTSTVLSVLRSSEHDLYQNQQSR